MKFTVRPDVRRVRPDGADAPNAVRAVLSRIDYRGTHWRMEFDAGVRIVVHLRPDALDDVPAAGRHYLVEFPPEAVHVLET